MRKVPEDIDREEVKRCVTSMFNLVGHRRIKDPQRPFTVGNLPPQVWVAFSYCSYSIYLFRCTHSVFEDSWAGPSCVLLGGSIGGLSGGSGHLAK
jgi:hypothetical protein